MRIPTKNTLFCLLLLFAFASPSKGEVTITNQWRLGVGSSAVADSIADTESQFLQIGSINLQTLDGNWIVHQQGLELTRIDSPAGIVATGVDYQVSYAVSGWSFPRPLTKP